MNPTSTTPSRNLPAELGETQHLSPRVIMREAAKVCEDLHLNITGGRLRKLVDQFLTNGRADIDFRTWFVSYADPTGDKATANVLRTRGF